MPLSYRPSRSASRDVSSTEPHLNGADERVTGRSGDTKPMHFEEDRTQSDSSDEDWGPARRWTGEAVQSKSQKDIPSGAFHGPPRGHSRSHSRLSTNGRTRRRRDQAPYAARFRAAASRHFVDIPRSPDLDTGFSNATNSYGTGESTMLSEALEEVDGQHGRAFDAELARPAKRFRRHYDRFHQDEMRMATREIQLFDALVGQLEAQGVLGPGPQAGSANEHVALANVIAAGDVLRRFPWAPPRIPPLPPKSSRPNAQANPRQLQDARLLRSLYQKRYAVYAALYKRHASAAWPDPSAVHAEQGALGDQITGMLDRRWRQAVQANFPHRKRSRSLVSTSSSLSSDSDSATDSSIPSGSEASQSTSGSSSGKVSSISASSPSRSQSPERVSKSQLLSGSVPTSRASSSSSPGASTSGSEGVSDEEDVTQRRSQLRALLETLDPPSALTEPLLGSIEADLRKVYVMLPSLLAYRRRPGPSSNAFHTRADPDQYLSAAQWGYEGPMLDWKDMLTVLQSNTGADVQGPSSTRSPRGIIPAQIKGTSAWPPVVPGNDPRENALRRTMERLKAIFEPARPHPSSPTSQTSHMSASDEVGSYDSHSTLPSETESKGKSGDEFESKSAVEDLRNMSSLSQRAARAASEARAMRQDLFSVPSLAFGSNWPSLVSDAFIPV